MRIRVRAGDAEDQARVRHEAVVDAEHGGAQVAAAAKAAVPVLDAAIPRRRRVTRIARERRPVDRHAAHFHRREHALDAARAELANERRDEPRARVGHVRRRRRAAARRQLRAPDRGLRFGFAGEAAEQLGARRAGLGLGAHAIEERGALFLVPAFERIRHVVERQADASAASMRAMTSGVSFGTTACAFMFSTTCDGAARAGDHRGDVRILEAPRKRHLRERAAQVGGDRREPFRPPRSSRVRSGARRAIRSP